MSRLLNKVPFRSLSFENQRKLREEYRIKYNEHYNYIFLLFVMFSLFLLLMVLGIVACLFDVMMGTLLSTLSLIGIIITAYFLYRTNDKFVRFLNKKGYRYK